MSSLRFYEKVTDMFSEMLSLYKQVGIQKKTYHRESLIRLSSVVSNIKGKQASLHFFHYFRHVLSDFFRPWTIVCNVSDGDDDHGFEVFPAKIFIEFGGIEGTHPARAESAISGGKAEMLGSDGDIDGAVWIIVVLAHPIFLHVHQSDDIKRRRAKPFAVVTRLKLFFRRF